MSTMEKCVMSPTAATHAAAGRKHPRWQEVLQLLLRNPLLLLLLLLQRLSRLTEQLCMCQPAPWLTAAQHAQPRKCARHGKHASPQDGVCQVDCTTQAGARGAAERMPH